MHSHSFSRFDVDCQMFFTSCRFKLGAVMKISFIVLVLDSLLADGKEKVNWSLSNNFCNIFFSFDSSSPWGVWLRLLLVVFVCLFLMFILLLLLWFICATLVIHYKLTLLCLTFIPLRMRTWRNSLWRDYKHSLSCTDHFKTSTQGRSPCVESCWISRKRVRRRPLQPTRRPRWQMGLRPYDPAQNRSQRLTDPAVGAPLPC